jgi:hypothetical protein
VYGAEVCCAGRSKDEPPPLDKFLAMYGPNPFNDDGPPPGELSCILDSLYATGNPELMKTFEDANPWLRDYDMNRIFDGGYWTKAAANCVVHVANDTLKDGATFVGHGAFNGAGLVGEFKNDIQVHLDDVVPRADAVGPLLDMSKLVENVEMVAFASSLYSGHAAFPAVIESVKALVHHGILLIADKESRTSSRVEYKIADMVLNKLSKAGFGTYERKVLEPTDLQLMNITSKRKIEALQFTRAITGSDNNLAALSRLENSDWPLLGKLWKEKPLHGLAEKTGKGTLPNTAAKEKDFCTALYSTENTRAGSPAVYFITESTLTEKSCYVGGSLDYKTRVQEHIAGKGNSQVKKWAEHAAACKQPVSDSITGGVIVGLSELHHSILEGFKGPNVDPTLGQTCPVVHMLEHHALNAAKIEFGTSLVNGSNGAFGQGPWADASANGMWGEGGGCCAANLFINSPMFFCPSIRNCYLVHPNHPLSISLLLFY